MKTAVQPASVEPQPSVPAKGGVRSVHVIQGEYEISDNPEIVLSTILGSCVAVCLRDPGAKIGGMNHFLLPFGSGEDGNTEKYGAYSMEVLINALLKAGVRRHYLEAKIFGGGRMMQGLGDIGNSNVNFARDFLECEGIPIISESTGGLQARRVKFWPVSGRAKQLLITPTDDLIEKPKLDLPPAETDDIEFF
ncbi:MAG: chemotaxis protein CheD [Pseudomonadota bacterium]